MNVEEPGCIITPARALSQLSQAKSTTDCRWDGVASEPGELCAAGAPVLGLLPALGGSHPSCLRS